MYVEQVPDFKTRELHNIHLGGGTPTFLAPENLLTLLKPILAEVKINAKTFEGSVEVDPRRTTNEHLRALREIGFNRISLGVQDFDPEVQRIVNRIQPLDITKAITESARQMGFDSVNYELIYGLPMQTETTVKKMAEITVQLRPDRIALYSFAKVPWIKPAQRLFKDDDIPEGESKRRLYEIARDILVDAGYLEIGMDHFALAHDPMAIAHEQKRLHRNFMGYADARTDVLLGLGVSSISEAPDCFHQNEKVLPVYERNIAQGSIPTFRGHKLNVEDRALREQILSLMTRMEVSLQDANQEQDLRQYLQAMIEDGLVEIESGILKVTPAGKPFLRNACMGLDQRLRHKTPNSQVFSQSI
jgi:oxygen-independent coproporphyrinogen-3 oxidase